VVVVAERERNGILDGTISRVREIRSMPSVSCHPKATAMIWTTPVLIEICVGLEINGYLPAEF
jgi:coenzyme PQQ precursor peptide PqqA